MTGSLTDTDWYLLLRRIEAGSCTPFLGAGACVPALPLAAEIAHQWADAYDYPVSDCDDLARVAQFLAVQYDPMFPKEEILRQFFDHVEPPDFTEADEPHGVLADLPLPVYVTTNYDDFMVQALESRGKAPRRDLCRWNKYIQDRQSALAPDPGFGPEPEKPVVFHLHGHDEVPESLVLAQGDYEDFLINISRSQDLLPPRIHEVLANTSLLFIGYSLEDWSFRVLYRGVVTAFESSLRRISVTVQMPPPKVADEIHLRNGDRITGKLFELGTGKLGIETEAAGRIAVASERIARVVRGGDRGTEIRQRQQEYLVRYFGSMDIRVYWGTAREFAAELGKRWKEFPHDG